MADSTTTRIRTRSGGGGASFFDGTGDGANGDGGGSRRPPKPARPKVKKLRLLLILSGLGLLALVSTVFGMLTSVASDLPQLENRAEYQRAENSTLLAESTGKGKAPGVLAKLTGNNNRILVKEKDISPNMENAVISIEDRRFFEHEGVDFKGIGRAFGQDLLHRRAAQGGSTITQQFVKNALAAQKQRSVFQKVREAALAYHLERKWTKQKVLTQYLNSIYFGNGAYGVEAAARTYFGERPATDPTTGQPAAQDVDNQGDLKTRAARDLRPAQAALLAGMIASPSLYDPVENPRTSKKRRNIVLARMREQRMISEQQYRQGLAEALPGEQQISPPRAVSQQPYFTSWLTQQLVDRYKAPAVFSGGLKVQTTLDPELQAAAQKAVSGRLAGVGPSASLVALDNKTGEVRAMVGGTDYATRPFNLATNGHRQPGSSFKPFTLIRALEDGVSPDATFSSQKKSFRIGGPGDRFNVNNYENEYSGVTSLRSATATSDNSVYAELGLKEKPKRIAALAQKMGIRTKVSDNPAMTLGGLREGLTPLELAQAYTTIANYGVKVSGSMAGAPGGPVGIDSVSRGGRTDHNRVKRTRVFSRSVAETAQQMLAGVVQNGTGRAAQIPEFAAGKTGTTENYGDAWFVGFNKDLTVAVWVGYPDKLQPMKTEYRGGEVAGGTYPAEIWHDVLTAWIGMRDRRASERKGDKKDGSEDTTTAPVDSAPSTGAGQSAPSTETPSTTPQESAPEAEQAPQTPDPAPQQAAPQTPAQPRQTPQQAPAPQPQTPSGGGGTGGGGAAPSG